MDRTTTTIRKRYTHTFARALETSRAARYAPPVLPRATTLSRFVPSATCSGGPRNSSAGGVTEEPLLARVLTNPPAKPALVTRTPSSEIPNSPCVCRGHSTHVRGEGARLLFPDLPESIGTLLP